MKKTVFTVMMVGLAASAFGQAAYLKVAAAESRSTRSGSYYSTNVEREEIYNVTVKNMTPTAYEYTVEWMFLVRPAGGGGKAMPFHVDEKKITLEKNASTTIEVRSPTLTSTESKDYYYSYYGGNTITGLKFAGYIVRVKANDKILAVEASDITLKRQYEDPKAKWGMPQPQP